jgi:purine nucleoside permease
MNDRPGLHRRTARRAAGALLALFAIAATSSTVRGQSPDGPRTVKVFVVTTTDAEASPWVSALGLTKSVPVVGLSAKDPSVVCNADSVCLVTTGVGKANAAASVAAVVFGGGFDLSHAYFLLASTAGMDPGHGTLGSVAWASHVVDFGISWEIDGRSLPAGWTTGYLGIDAMSPTQKPLAPFGTEVYTLDATLVAKAASLSHGASLTDGAQAMSCRAQYSGSPATAAPAVVACDASSGDTLWQGALLGARAASWTTLLAGSGATYCARAREDNAAITALERGAGAGLLDAKRIVVEHAASSFDRPPPGQSPFDALVACGDAGAPAAVANLVAAGKPLVAAIVGAWSQWQNGVPQ